MSRTKRQANAFYVYTFPPFIDQNKWPRRENATKLHVLLKTTNFYEK